MQKCYLARQLPTTVACMFSLTKGRKMEDEKLNIHAVSKSLPSDVSDFISKSTAYISNIDLFEDSVRKRLERKGMRLLEKYD